MAERTKAAKRSDKHAEQIADSSYEAAPSSTGAGGVWEMLQGSIGNQAVGRLVEAQRTASSEGLTPIDPGTQERIDMARNEGVPLGPGMRTGLEAALGNKLPDVRLHTDPGADAMARGLNARAFTQGRDVFLRSDRHPSTRDGMATLVHEMTHVSDGRTSSGSVQRDGEGQEITGYTPPESLTGGLIGGDMEIASVNPGGLYDAVKGLKWPSSMKDDPGWGGWGIISGMGTQDFWRGNLRNATSGPLVQPFPAHEANGGLLNSNIEIRAKMTEIKYEADDGIAIGSGTAGGGTVGSSDANSQANMIGGTATLGGAGTGSNTANSGGPTGGPSASSTLGGGPTGSVAATASSTNTTTRTGLSGFSGIGTTQTAPSASVKFTFKVDFQITVRQHIQVSTLDAVRTLGGANAGAWIAENPLQTTTVQGTGAVRVLKSACKPIYKSKPAAPTEAVGIGPFTTPGGAAAAAAGGPEPPPDASGGPTGVVGIPPFKRP